MNRRDWIKSSGTLLAGGLSLLASPVALLNSKSAGKTIGTGSLEYISDEEVLRALPPGIQARLSANENPFGPSLKAKQAIREAIDQSYQYPFRNFGELISKITEAEGIEKDQILLSAGSSPLLLAGAMHFASKGTIITGDPSYNDLPRKAEDLGAKVISVPLTSDYKLDLKTMEKQVDGNTALVYICNPNNPTGTTVDAEELKSFCKRVSEKVPVFIDEAYIDYLEDVSSQSMIPLVKEGYDVIVARTFSKLYGFAGLRVGYMVSSEEMADTLGEYTRGAMSVSATSLNAAIAAYDDTQYLNYAKKETFESKDYLYDTLKKEGYTWIPSETNFVMFPIHMEGKRFIQEMGKRGVSIRSWTFDNQHWCRVSVGTMPEMEVFAGAFHEIS